MDLLNILTFAILIWLGILTYFLYRLYRVSLNNRAISNNIDTEDIDEIKRFLVELSKQEKKHIQKLGFTRFNPFNETGGDNSFSIVILDGNSDGIVLTGLHTRDKTRMYAKKIENGKSKYELSNEEKKVINEVI